jgi:hypothetical protein
VLKVNIKDNTILVFSDKLLETGKFDYLFYKKYHKSRIYILAGKLTKNKMLQTK